MARKLESSHNYLRISRILKCLSEMGLERLNAGFLLHVLTEQSEHGQLRRPSLENSMDNWWAGCIRDNSARNLVTQCIRGVRDGTIITFTRKRYEDALVSLVPLYGKHPDPNVTSKSGAGSPSTDGF